MLSHKARYALRALVELARQDGAQMTASDLSAAADAGTPLADGDIVVVTSKIVSKAEGRLVELAPKATLFAQPRHPYTRMLLDAIPDIAMTGRQRTPVQGEVPNPLNPPSGCAFHPRCPHANARCSAERPELVNFQDIRIACHAVIEGRL